MIGEKITILMEIRSQTQLFLMMSKTFLSDKCSLKRFQLMCGHHIFCFEDVHQFINFIQTNEMVLKFYQFDSIKCFCSSSLPRWFCVRSETIFLQSSSSFSSNLSDDVGYFWTLLTNIFRMKIDFKRPI